MPTSQQHRLDEKNERKAARAKAQKRPSVPFQAFYNVHLTEDQQTRAKDIALNDPAKVGRSWEMLITAGFSISAKFDDQEDLFLVTAFCNDSEKPTAGFMLSQRASSLPRAIVGLAMQWAESLQGDHEYWMASIDNVAKKADF